MNAVRQISRHRVAIERDGTVRHVRPAAVRSWLFRAESDAIAAALDRAHRMEIAHHYLAARAARQPRV